MTSEHNTLLILGDCNSPHSRKWAEGLIKKNFTVSVFSFYPCRDNWAMDNKIEVISFYANEKFSSFKKIFYILATFKVRRTIKRKKISIINSHYASSYGLIGVLSGAKTILTSFWGTDIFVFPKKNFVTKQVIKLVLRRSSRILSSSKIMALEINKYTSRKIDVIYFGVDTDKFRPIINSLKQSKPFKIGIVKTLSSIYRIDVAIKAVNQFSSLEAELHICGDGPLRSELELMANSNIYFHGRIPNIEVPNFINNMDVILNTTDFESLGVSILEAMSCGIPVIAFDAGGPSEIIANDEDGILYSPNNPEILKSKIDLIISSPELRSKLAENCRKKIESTFDFDVNLEELNKIIVNI